MIKRFYILLVFFSFAVLFIQCNKPKEKKVSKDIIQRGKMIDILYDIQLIEGAYRYKQSHGEDISDKSKYIYAGLFKKHNVSKEQFDKSIKYYTNDYNKLSGMYEEVITRLSRVQSEKTIK